MKELLKQLWPLKRSLVSDGYDEALNIISKKYPIETARYPSGTECWTWFIPEKWTCHEAYLETIAGERLIDYRNHPLHCIDYSKSVDMIVDRNILFQHLYVSEKNDDAIPYVFKFYERDWGLCCTKVIKNKLRDEKYHIRIDTKFEKGELKVGQYWVRGKSDKIFVILAHLCHPCMANDDLSGVVVALELMERLKAVAPLNYNYLLLLVPETIGTIAWMSHNENLIPKISGGIFLEMLGHDAPHALQRSYLADTQVDKCLEHILFLNDIDAYCRGFDEIVRNDELEFNAPSFRIPVLSLSRCFQPESPEWPYPEYHTHLDSPEIISQNNLDSSLEMAFEMLSANDRNCYPKAKFKGQVFCSRYGLFPAKCEDQIILRKVLFELDGQHSIIDICLKHKLKFNDVYKIIESLIGHNLVEVSF